MLISKILTIRILFLSIRIPKMSIKIPGTSINWRVCHKVCPPVRKFKEKHQTMALFL